MYTKALRFLPALLLALPACGLIGGSPTTEMKESRGEVRYQWTGSLFTPSELAGAMQVRGTATWAPAGDNRSEARVNISNATPGGQHPWRIHEGRCGDNGPVVGDSEDYKLLKVDDDGRASQRAELDVPLPRSGIYHVNVNAASVNMTTIISCGNLAPPVE